ncbi:MAG: hypothetical protein M3R55_09550 [Acidobacteriota bacterium]|nr:hypothetical protein [Acidobacteriota bacterium]
MSLAPASTGLAREVASSQSAAPAALKPYVVEYYYKVKWGHFDEFLELYKKNHYPILKKMQEQGHILSMSAAYPRNHASEPARWDMRFTIVYRDVLAEHLDTGDALVEQLYPDQVRFRKEEQRRFELLLEHTDIPVVVEDAREWK